MRIIGLFLLMIYSANSPAIGDEEIENAFLELTIEDTPRNWRLSTNFMDYVQVAVRGDANVQVIVAGAIFDNGDKATAARLYQTTLDQQGLDVAPKDTLYLNGITRLGYMYTQGKHVPLELEKGLHLLVESASRGDRLGSLYMADLLAGSNLIPSSSKLADLWSVHADDHTIFSISDLEEKPKAEQNSEGFSECGTYFSRIPEIMDIRDKTQQEIFDNPESSDQIIARAYEEINALDSPKLILLTFNFQDFPGLTVMYILASEHDLELEVAPGFVLPTFMIKVKNVPRSLVFAQIVSDLNLIVSCRSQEFRLEYVEKAQIRALQKRIYLPDFMKSKELIADSLVDNAYRIRWNDGHIYEGQLKNNKPWGKGVFRFADGDTMSGTFEDGVLHGMGEYKSELMPVLRSGHFLQGVLDGDGVWINEVDGFHFDGPFTRGRFNGDGEINLQAGMISGGGTVVYQGAFRDHQPHGDGKCTAALLGQLEYPCAFHKGDLIRVGKVSLFPRQVN